MILIDKIFLKLIDIGYESFKNDKEAKILRRLVKENLKRELSFNIALCNGLMKRDTN
jgi:hypothetical protein